MLPSPKLQPHVVTCPVDVLAKVTASGATPLVRLATKFATGAGIALTMMGVLAILRAVPPGPVADKATT